MKLLVVSQYFWPEAFVINDLVKTLRDQGHSVVIATGKPNYPEGRVFDGYRAEGTQTETFDGDIPVVRVPLRPRGSGSGMRLFANYLSFAWSGWWRFPLLLKQHDADAIIVFAVSPITAALPAIRLKFAKRAHLAIWVQDLWPESLAATGHIRSRSALFVVGLMVRAIYACADTLLVQSRGFVEAVAQYARREKIVYYPNSIKTLATALNDSELPAHLAETLGSRFCVVFTGNIGSVQAMPTVVEAAALLAAADDVCVVLIGSGSMSTWVRERAAHLGLTNMVCVDRLPSAAMAPIYARSQALLVTLNDHDALSRVVPSKMQAYLAAGRPIIAAVRGEGARVVVEAAAGVTCAPEDPGALADCLRAFRKLPEAERVRMGEAGRRYFLDQFDMNRQAARLVEILTERMAVNARTSSGAEP